MQLGGGIRTRGAIDNWLEKGVARVILGTAAVRDPELVREAAQAYPGQIAVGLDARHGKVAIEGWLETSEQDASAIAKSFEDAGVAAIVYTDIDRDGVLTGVNWEATIALADAVSIPVIASGGLASMADIERLTRPEPRSWPALSPDARSMTGASIRKKRWRCWQAYRSVNGQSRVAIIPSGSSGRRVPGGSGRRLL